MIPRPARLAPAFAMLAVLGCQPADEPALEPTDEVDADDAATEPVGAPQVDLPESLEALLGELEGTAREWQAGPVPAEIVVEVDDEARWTGAAVTYLAPDADRFLLLRLDGDGLAQERLTLEGFDLHPVPAEALEDVPAPDGLLDPAELLVVSDEVLEQCGVGAPVTVVYATGAPSAWDGERWTEEPAWSATLSAERAAVVDPETGEPADAPCVDA